MESFEDPFLTIGVILAVVIWFACLFVVIADIKEKSDHNKVVEEAKKKKKKSSKREKRVKFADDVMVRNIDHFEVAEEPIIKDFELSHVKLSEKVELLDNLSEGDHKFGSEVVVVKKESQVLPCSEESVKECDDVNLLPEVVKVADDVMVRNIDHFEVAEEPIIKDFELSHVKLSEKVELLDNLSEGDHKFGSEVVVVKKESQVLPCSEESVKECDDVNLLPEVVKGDVDEQDAGFLLDKKEVDGVDGEKTVLADCLKALDAGEIDREAAMGSVKKDDIVADQKVRISETRLSEEALVGEAIESNIQSAEVNLAKSSEDLILDGQNAVDMARSDGNKVQTVEEEVLGKTNELNIDDDDWEGVESSELEKVFAEAVSFVEYGRRGKDDQMANLGNDVQMQLYGLHRLALDGPCQEPQPMALKISARAKWALFHCARNAWHRFGSMSPEVAMQQYIKLLSDTDPGWMQDSSAEDGKQEFVGSKSTGSPDTEKALHHEDVQGDAGDERNREAGQKTLIHGGGSLSI